MARAFLGLGSNLGDREQLLRTALDRLVAVGLVGTSPFYETDPVGGPEQGAFLNAVAELDTDLSPRQLLALCGRLEQAASNGVEDLDLAELRNQDAERQRPRRRRGTTHEGPRPHAALDEAGRLQVAQRAADRDS